MTPQLWKVVCSVCIRPLIVAAAIGSACGAVLNASELEPRLTVLLVVAPLAADGSISAMSAAGAASAARETLRIESCPP